MEILFWLCFGSLAWCYAGYPLVLRLRARLGPDSRVADGRANARSSSTFASTQLAPTVSIVLAVRNEAQRLRSRLRNLLAQEYPSDRFEVVVVHNGCTDDTEKVAQAMARQDSRVRVLESPAEAGKAGALNSGVAAAFGDYIVFADARQQFAPDALRLLCERLSEPEVGAVSGRLVMDRTDTPSLAGIRQYWEYETKLRLAESATGSVAGVTGAIYAIRRELFCPLPPGLILDDVFLPMKIVQQGHRVVLAPEAVAFDVSARDQNVEFDRRLRMAVGNLQLLRVMPELLVPWRNPIFGRYVSHKVLRVVSPVFVLAMLLFGLLLEGFVYREIALVQAGFYALGVLGLVVRLPLLSLPASFVLVHVALIRALLRLHEGTSAVWYRSKVT